MKINFNESINNKAECLVISLCEELTLSDDIKKIDASLDNIISEAIDFGKFQGKKSEVFQIFAGHKDFPKLILLVGYGKAANLTRTKTVYLGGRILANLNLLKIDNAQIFTSNIKIEKDDVAALIAQGIGFRSYKFNKYRTKDIKDHEITVKSVEVQSNNASGSIKEYDILKATIEGVYFTKDLVSEPPNVIYPETLANRALELKELGVEVEILGKEDMLKLGMGSLLGVGQGSIRESKIAIMRYKNNVSEGFDLALVGKGVTFDTGGISLKPATGMEDMKYDMAGAGVVMGTIKSLALRKAKVNVVGLVGLVENMPGGNAQRPSDVVTSMSGQTIEVLNTDAEGRLVLADVLWYAQEKYKPKAIIDLATLTGAITITFGMLYGGLFSNNDDFADKMFKAGIESDEKVWRLPMGEYYDKMINSEIADMQNISSEKGAGSITAAQFLKRFIKDETPWIHLDIAGMSWTRKETDIQPKGATAFGVRLLNQYIKDNLEK